ncbi:baculoviral IAP repeat-containing protein 7-like isoform X2 [Palaemon carinicauda]|uniref:baculoviral IAP repeat-containing protein 7-like isoform X2 n=1 Tax=Palaemon carinicauda TaxID=392227 RepID=UPI0035B648E6
MSGIQYDGRMVTPAPNSVTKRQPEDRAERRFHWQSALLLEAVRRQTFSNWPVAYIDPDELAKAGFFYLRTEDHVQCAFCQGIVGYWDEGDKPEIEHHKHFPNCPFITGAATGNVPRNGSDDDSTALFNFLYDYHTFRVSNTRPQQLNTSYQTDSTKVPDGGQLAFPHLNTVSNRLSTYTRWPKHVNVGPDVLAEAGFFSTGLADWVQCFHCGGGLYGWRFGDNPLVDHARFYPFCPYARGKLGDDAVNNALNENPPPVSSSRKINITDAEAELLLHHPMAKRLVGMGLSPVSVREALRHLLETRGILCRTVTEALEHVFDYEENQRRNSTCGQLGHDGLILPVEMSSSPSFSTSPASTKPSADYTKLLEEVETLRNQVTQEERRLLCRLCQKSQIAVVFQPCSHLHLCAECARPRDTCPSCGAVVRGTLKPILT